MANIKSFRVTYEIVNIPAAKQGSKYLYRRGVTQAMVAAANIAGIAAILAGDLTLGAGETIEILDAHEEASVGGLLT